MQTSNSMQGKNLSKSFSSKHFCSLISLVAGPTSIITLHPLVFSNQQNQKKEDIDTPINHGVSMLGLYFMISYVWGFVGHNLHQGAFQPSKKGHFALGGGFQSQLQGWTGLRKFNVQSRILNCASKYADHSYVKIISFSSSNNYFY